jgi:hypothetical protein
MIFIGSKPIQDYCYATIKMAAMSFLIDKVAYDTRWLTPEQKRNVISALVNYIDETIQHHAEKVFDEDRLSAGCQLIVKELELKRRKDLEDKITELTFQAGGTVTYEDPELLLKYGPAANIMPSDLCDYCSLPEASTYKEGREATGHDEPLTTNSRA